MTYRKLRFSSRYGTTTELVCPAHKVDRASITEISRLFPYSEALKMGILEWTPLYLSWDAAFDAPFTVEGRTTVNIIR